MCGTGMTTLAYIWIVIPHWLVNCIRWFRFLVHSFSIKHLSNYETQILVELGLGPDLESTLGTKCDVLDKHDRLACKGLSYGLFVLYCLEWDNPYEYVLCIELTRLACLGLPCVNTALLSFACHGQLQFGGFNDGPATRISGWAVGFGPRLWFWIVGNGLGPCYYS